MPSALGAPGPAAEGFARRDRGVGVLAAVLSATAYAVTVVVGRDLATSGVGGPSALGTRFGIAGLTLLAVQAIRRAPVLPRPGERWRVFLLGGVGYGIESSCFYAALGRGSAGAVSLIFYAYPAMVLVVELVLRQMQASARLLSAVGLSVAGTALVVGAGGELTITLTGALFALAAAAAFTTYFLLSHTLVHDTDPVVNATWVSIGAATAMVVRGVAAGELALPSGRTAELVAYGVAGAVAFGAMFVALPRLGPSRTAVILTFETVATVTLAALWLDERLRAIQLVGGAAIATGAVLAALTGTPPAAAEEMP
jgi:drug/metabolite transporter (DMT)-like permease